MWVRPGASWKKALGKLGNSSSNKKEKHGSVARPDTAVTLGPEDPVHILLKCRDDMIRLWQDPRVQEILRRTVGQVDHEAVRVVDRAGVERMQRTVRDVVAAGGRRFMDAAMPGTDDLKALCAAFGTTSAAPMLHVDRITPEAGRIGARADPFRITPPNL